ncbi:unnamed protein product [Acanthoscelides obtectus]|uniref:Uncharacterized protein n=1 Tax=Acanthoscelides obtectus TaxID=200917 RepID=A0A9P0VPY6_ACAOB|nr:unnamed protein product [Acanthoscelides obtectus]CAK1627083.1 hypothetical protein AOBTE_LOCUS4289 [Acanthoscelides obtectus]
MWRLWSLVKSLSFIETFLSTISNRSSAVRGRLKWLLTVANFGVGLWRNCEPEATLEVFSVESWFRPVIHPVTKYLFEHFHD